MLRLPTLICLLLLLLVPGACAEPEDEAAWRERLEAITAIEDDLEAIGAVDALTFELEAEGSLRSKHRRGELWVRCKVPRVPMMQKGAITLEAIALFEEVLAEQPDAVDTRYLLARTCLALPGLFGRKDQGVAALEHLVAQADAEPGSVPFPDAFLRLARLRPETARETLEIGLRSFPDDAGLQAAVAELGTSTDPASDAPSLSGDPKAAFHEALLAGRADFDALDRALAAAGADQPTDHEFPLFRALLRLWKTEQVPGPDAVVEAIELFRRALELDPEDTRIYGWLGPAVYALGVATGDGEGAQEGEALMSKGVELNPEQNRFGRAFIYRMTGTHLDRVEDDLYRTVELCMGEPLDRTRFLPTASTSEHTACADSEHAPYNLSGTFHWAGDFFRSQGDVVRAKDAYEAALRVDTKGTWPYRPLAEARLAELAGESGEAVRGPAASCLLCHQR